MTPFNSYRFVWTDAAINRDTNNLVSAALELFRNGDTCVTTNGTVRWGHRALPFPHDGFGQDDAWSSADSSVCTCDGAQDRTATFTCKFPAAYGSGVSLAHDVMLNRTTLHADYWRGYYASLR